MLVIERQTYSLLDWLGDLGGLFDALYFLGFICAGPVTAIALNSLLVKTNFDFLPSFEQHSDPKLKREISATHTLRKNKK